MNRGEVRQQIDIVELTRGSQIAVAIISLFVVATTGFGLVSLLLTQIFLGKFGML